MGYKFRYRFAIDGNELRKIKEWDVCNAADAGVEGGKFTYKFIPTGLGLIKLVHCCVCDRELDLTDYKNFG